MVRGPKHYFSTPKLEREKIGDSQRNFLIGNVEPVDKRAFASCLPKRSLDERWQEWNGAATPTRSMLYTAAQPGCPQTRSKQRLYLGSTYSLEPLLCGS